MIPPTGLGDLFRAWHALGARDEQSRRLIRDALLGEDDVDWQPAGAPSPEPAPPPEPGEQPITAAGAAGAASPAEAPAGPDAAGWREPVDFRVEVAEPEGIQTVQLPATAAALARDRRLPVEPEPLLVPAWGPRIVSAFVATEAPLGDVDVERLVVALARLRGVRRLPRKLRPTLRRGVQLLVDRDASMMPLYSDQVALYGLIQAIVGRARSHALRCDTFPPGRVSALTVTRWGPYEPPPGGTPVLVASDLGMARGAFPLSRDAERRWEAFLAPLREAGCPVTALVPCDPERYPPFVRSRVRLLLWDAGTRPSDARRARRGGTPG